MEEHANYRADNPEVAQINREHQVVRCLREIADDIERGKYKGLTAAFLVLEVKGQVAWFGRAPEDMSLPHSVGLLESAKLAIMHRFLAD